MTISRPVDGVRIRYFWRSLTARDRTSGHPGTARVVDSLRRRVRVLVFHGYLLRGTGSNVYNASLAAALVALGHDVHLLSQERHPEQLPFVDAVGSWERGRLDVETLREPVRCTAYLPDIGGLLPVYVADRYDGIEARPFPECSDEEVERYVAANVDAVRDVTARVAPDVALANHLVMGPAILARALAGTGVTYAVKIHGSALEYTVKPHPRFLPWAHEGMADARGVLVGSRHVASSLWAALDDPDLPPRTRLGPPGVDIAHFRPLSREEAGRSLRELAEHLSDLDRSAAASDADSAFARDAGAAAAAVADLADGDDRLVVYVGKLLAAKGVDLLLAAWPLVLARVPQARLVIVGFGSFEPTLRRFARALASGDLAAAAEAAGPELRYVRAFLDGLDEAAAGRYRDAAARLDERVVWTGRLEHEELASLLPACDAQVVPSTFPEAFGMVAAEAAACGVLPVSADHSGLAEVTAALRDAAPAEVAPLLSFSVGPAAVVDLADRLVRWLKAPAELRADTRAALAAVARERFGWEGVARGVVAAARGELDSLPAAA
jgi:glycosyltransferase involved in cell wall biosynthesis